jgi:cytochrome c biogenesis protein CcmG/thiol:disulfide interchange protein DsbE
MSIPEPLKTLPRPATSKVVLLVVLLIAVGGVSYGGKDEDKDAAKEPAKTAEKESPEKENTGPCVTDPSKTPQPTGGDNIPRFGDNSPFDKDYKPPALKRERMLWASSFLWSEAPEFVVEKWLTDKPDTKGKYVLIEYWATWCGPCRRSIPLLNGFHKKYGDELVVIGISEESEEDVRKMVEPKIDFHLAIDTKKRMKNELGVFGIPHIIILEPGGCVIWEGFPLQKGYELTDEIITKILEVGRKLREKEDAKKPRDASKPVAN